MPLLGVLMLIGFHLDTSVVHASDFSVDDLKVLATGIATAHGLNSERFLATIECESKWNKNAVGALGEIGLVQIYPKYHKDISKEQMRNPLWSMNWMAEQWEKGHQKFWSCFSSLGAYDK